MEFEFFSSVGAKKTIEGESLKITDHDMIVNDKDGNPLAWVNRNAIIFVIYHKPEQSKLVVAK